MKELIEDVMLDNAIYTNQLKQVILRYYANLGLTVMDSYTKLKEIGERK